MKTGSTRWEVAIREWQDDKLTERPHAFPCSAGQPANLKILSFRRGVPEMDDSLLQRHDRGLRPVLHAELNE
jgi:hypothetical protein